MIKMQSYLKSKWSFICKSDMDRYAHTRMLMQNDIIPGDPDKMSERVC